MANKIDVNATANALIKAVRSEAQNGWTLIENLVTSQSRMMAQQAAWIAQSSMKGDLKDDAVLRQLFLDQLADSVRQLGRDVAALTILTVEKVWNAAVNVLWGAVNQVLSTAGLGALALPVL